MPRTTHDVGGFHFNIITDQTEENLHITVWCEETTISVGYTRYAEQKGTFSLNDARTHADMRSAGWAIKLLLDTMDVEHAEEIRQAQPANC